MIYNIGSGGGGGGNNNVIEGYYINGHFYDSPTPAKQEIPGELNKIYVDLVTDNLYYYSGSEFVLSTASIQIVRW